MKTEYKAAGVRALEDHGDGRVTAYVSVTGIEDNVKDVIEPGAYIETLQKRIPKGVWSHDWTRPISRTEDVAELPPLHPDLPKQLPNGQPWPKEAGAVKVDTLFNLASPEGYRAYQDVKFFGDQQEWSIGYKVPEGGATYDKKTGVRHIHKLDWFEYSPVLFGAMSAARTKVDEPPSVSAAQLAHKTLNGVDISDILAELKKWESEHPFIEVKGADPSEFKGDEPPSDYDEDDEDMMEDEYDEEDEDGEEDEEEDYGDDEDDEYEDEEGEEEKGLSLDLIRETIANLELIEEKMGKPEPDYDEDDEEEEEEEYDEDEQKALQFGAIAYYEAKAVQYDTVTEAIQAIDIPMTKNDAEALVAAAEAFDTAVESEDKAAAEQAAGEILDVLEVLVKDFDQESHTAACVARVISDKMHKLDDEEESEETDGREDNDDYADDEEDETSEEYKYVDNDGIEYKNIPFGDRTFGFPRETKDRVDALGEDGVRAFIGGLDSLALETLDMYLEHTDVDPDMKLLVEDEIETRVMLGTFEAKVRGKRIARVANFWRLPNGRYVAPGQVIPPSAKRAPKKPTKQGAKKAATTKASSAVKSTRGSAKKPAAKKAPMKSAAEKRAAKPSAGRAARDKDAAADKERVEQLKRKRDIKEATSRDEAHERVKDLSMRDLRQLADDLEMGDYHRALARNKTDLRRLIVESQVGSRLDHEALRGRSAPVSSRPGGDDDDKAPSAPDQYRADRLENATREELVAITRRQGWNIAPELLDQEAGVSTEYLRRYVGEELGIPGMGKRDTTDPAELMRQHQLEVGRMRQARAEQWERLTPSERRGEIMKQISRDPTLQREMDRVDLSRGEALRRANRTRVEKFRELSHGTMGVVTAEEYERMFYDMKANRARALEELAELEAVSPQQAQTRRSWMDWIRRVNRNKEDEFEDAEYKREFTTEKRDKYAKQGIALPDGSYPIPDVDALKRAIKACGRARDKEAAKAHIKKRAEALGRSDLIPEEWSSKSETVPTQTEVVDLTELKALTEFIQTT